MHLQSSAENHSSLQGQVQEFYCMCAPVKDPEQEVLCLTIMPDSMKRQDSVRRPGSVPSTGSMRDLCIFPSQKALVLHRVPSAFLCTSHCINLIARRICHLNAKE